MAYRWQESGMACDCLGEIVRSLIVSGRARLTFLNPGVNILGTKLDIVTGGRLLSWSPLIRSCRPGSAPIIVRNAKSANDTVVVVGGTGESQEKPVSTSEFESVKKIVESVDVAVDIVEDCERGGVVSLGFWERSMSSSLVSFVAPKSTSSSNSDSSYQPASDTSSPQRSSRSISSPESAFTFLPSFLFNLCR